MLSHLHKILEVDIERRYDKF